MRWQISTPLLLLRPRIDNSFELLLLKRPFIPPLSLLLSGVASDTDVRELLVAG